MATVLDEERLTAFKAVGIEIIGVGLDAASEAVFYRTRGRGARGPHSWVQHWEIVRIARRLFGPWKVNCHVIVGLGETDQELVDLFYATQAERIEAYLFSFNPEPGTAMADVPRAPIHRLRRIQLVKHLIEENGLSPEAVKFGDDGGIVRLDAPRETVEAMIESGTPFMTDGCPDKHGKLACNRPFGSYRPGEEFRDYPFIPLADDRLVIRRQLRLEEIMTNVQCEFPISNLQFPMTKSQ
jgi:biotin synthase